MLARSDETFCSATPICSSCEAVVVGKVTVRPEYTLVTCLNRVKRAGRSCGRQSLLIPDDDNQVRVLELSPEESRQIRGEPRWSLRELLPRLGVRS